MNGKFTTRKLGLADARLLPVVVMLLITSIAARGSVVDGTADINAYQNSALLFAVHGDAIVLMHPGLLLDPTLDLTDISHQVYLSMFLNKTVRLRLLYEPADYDVGRLYSDILNNAEWATIPLISSQRAELKGLRAQLFSDGSEEPLPAYKLYLELKANYEKLQAAFDQTPPEQRTAEQRHELQEARTDLRLRGRENHFRPTQARYKNLLQQASLEWRGRDIEKLNAALISADQPFYRTTTFPQLDEQQLTWSPVQLRRSQLSLPRPLPRFGTNHGVIGWWRWSDTPALTPNDRFESLGTDDFTLGFEYANVIVERDWLDWNVFGSPAWRFRDDKLISNGLDDGNSGAAPGVVVGLVLIRNVRLSGDAVRTVASRMRTAVRSNHSVGFGPIRLSGNSEGPIPVFLAPTIYRSQIDFPFPQIAAVIVRVLPKSPAPNSGFEWPQTTNGGSYD